MNDKLTTYDENDRSDTVLDRAWAATRPADLTDESFDQIWANVQDAHDYPSVASPRQPLIRHQFAWVLIPASLAAAAAIFVAAFVVARPVGRDGDGAIVAQHSAKPVAESVVVSTPYDLEPHETLVIEIDGNTVRDHRLEPDAKTALALNDIPANSSTDILNWMESHSND